MIPFKRYCPETYTDLTDWVTHSLTYFDCYPLTLWKIQNIKYKKPIWTKQCKWQRVKVAIHELKGPRGSLLLVSGTPYRLAILGHVRRFVESSDVDLNTGHAGLSSQRNYTATERRWKWSPKKMTETWTRLRRHQWPHQMIPRTVTCGPLRRQVR